MGKRWMSVILACTMFLALAVPAWAAPVTPAAPSWWEGEEYLTFPGDEVYEPANWQKVLTLRSQAETGYIPAVRTDWDYDAGKEYWYYDKKLGLHMGWENASESPQPSLGTQYEIALVMVKYALNDYEKNGEKGAFEAPYVAFGSVARGYLDQKHTEDSTYENLTMWSLRFSALANYDIGHSLYQNYTAKDKSLEEFFDSPWMDLLPAGRKETLIERAEEYIQYAAYERQRLKLFIDGHELRSIDTVRNMEIKDGRTMVPLRVIAERLGATVDWDNDTKTVTMTRAKQTVVMTVGSKTAYVDGKAMAMDVTPYIKNDRTLLPARYVAEFFGQKVDWDADNNKVSITEDFSVEGTSNLRAWAIPMGSMIRRVAHGALDYGRPRSITIGFHAITPVKEARDNLADGWGIYNREDLIDTILYMTDHGHSESFLKLAQSSYANAYTRQVYNKYGSKGILAWDLFRMSNLAQWGYNAGYVTYAESLALIQPAAQRLKDNFSSWEEAYENYLYGYCWWSGTGVAGQDIFQTERGVIYTEMMANEEYKAFFDNSLFSQEIIPVPGVSAEDLRKELS